VEAAHAANMACRSEARRQLFTNFILAHKHIFAGRVLAPRMSSNPAEVIALKFVSPNGPK
jgi:hypothetical protein